MRTFWVLLRREWAGWFLSPLAYVLSTFFLLVMGFSFWMLLNLLASGAGEASVLSELFSSIFFWLALLILIPVMTMRLLAEEHRSGTLETLMTAPVGDTTVVLAKFFGVLGAYVCMWMPTLIYVGLVAHYSMAEYAMDIGPLISGYLGALLVGSFYLSVGLLASSLTRSQIVAAIISFALISLFFLMGFLPYVVQAGSWRTTGLYVSSVAHMMDFSRGVVDSRPVVLYLSGILFMLFGTVKALESRKWR